MILSARHLTLGYNGQAVVHDVHFDLPEGAHLAILGPNGSGKTTLLAGLLGILPALAGAVVRPDRGIGYLPQLDAIPANFPASVQEVVQSGALGGRRLFLTAEDKKRTMNHLHEVGLPDIRQRSFHALSGGQRRRVLIARALCAADRLLFLDEPTAGLDQDAAQDLYDLLAHLSEAHRLSMVTVSHDMALIRHHADYFLVMDDGHAVFFGDRAAHDCALAKGEVMY